MADSMLESPTLFSTSAPLKQTTLSAQSYVLSLASLPSLYAASASSPANVIDLFDKSTLQGVQTLSGHGVAITSLKAVETIANLSRTSLVTSGKDGVVNVWDERSNTVSIKMTTSGKIRPLLCCDVSPDGLTVAAGSDLQGDDALILYWDPRNPVAPLRTHSSTHSDDITALQFLRNQKSSAPHPILLSASSDGLISTSDPSEDDEDEAVLNVGNWGCSISQAGWIYGSNGPQIWASSDMETFSTWSDELDQLQSIDIRGPSVHNQRRTWVTDYVIAGHAHESSFGLFVGSNEGDVALISNPDLADSTVPWHLQSLWTTGHTGIVRSMLWDEENAALVTGGEDGKVNLWKIPPVETLLLNSNAMDVDSPVTKKREFNWDEHQDSEDVEGKRPRRM